jgi:hypothetical protein
MQAADQAVLVHTPPNVPVRRTHRHGLPDLWTKSKANARNRRPTGRHILIMAFFPMMRVNNSPVGVGAVAELVAILLICSATRLSAKPIA